MIIKIITKSRFCVDNAFQKEAFRISAQIRFALHSWSYQLAFDTHRLNLNYFIFLVLIFTF